ncbi:MULTISPECIES: hypothetical protein [Enterobacterales]|jgi:hypothetical protein|uniref:Lipoprotein n=5 Tax=Morganellaceae TaxID=1903414 RepID=A0A899NF88_PROST|nr:MULTISPECIES: hypothetical protein [Enterobacterales]URQ57435.1 Hypothetical protein [Providencia alcalifaciens]EKH6496489.1 hypothetical protein [Providencia rettgeri]ELB1110431.1 hypothetical protein [Morganella morganii]ELL8907437.1 hypothetical protein [Proteus mirabilis]ELQ1458014.1 hypothetical protein [Providencia rettgeri]
MKSSIAIFIAVLSLGSIPAQSAPLPKESIGEIAGSHGAVLAAIAQCRAYIESPSSRGKEIARQMQRALSKALGAEQDSDERAQAMTDYMQETVEKYTGQLKTQFDEIGASSDFRREKCEQLIAGSIARAEQIDIKHGVK